MGNGVYKRLPTDYVGSEPTMQHYWENYWNMILFSFRAFYK